MTLRFTDTDKWRDPWFRKLPPWGKLLWQFLCDNCDAAGVWQADKEMADMFLGQAIPWDEVPQRFHGRIRELPNDRWLVTKFVIFQQPKGLHPRDNYGKAVLRLLYKHGLTPEDVYLHMVEGVFINSSMKGLARGLEGASEGLPSPSGKGKGNGEGEGEREQEPPAKKPSNRQALAKTLRRLGLRATEAKNGIPGTLDEWGDMMQGRGGCQTPEEVLTGIAWIVDEAARSGIKVEYAKHAAGLADKWRMKLARESA
jgi:hypothetical protein